MTHAGGVLRIGVLGDSSATLYSQEDPHQALRQLGARAWPEALVGAASPVAVEVLPLAGVGQQLSQGLARRYQQLVDYRPDVVVIAHGGREAVVGLPRMLAWLRCYARDEAPDSGKRRWAHRLRRPVWHGLVAFIDRFPRLAQRVLWLAHIRAVQPDTAAYSAQLSQTVRWLVEGLDAHVVLLTTNLSHLSYWPVFRHIYRANDAAAVAVAAQLRGRVSVLSMQSRLSRRDFAADGVHLNPSGHQRAARMVWQHIESTSLPAIVRADKATKPRAGVA